MVRTGARGPSSCTSSWGTTLVQLVQPLQFRGLVARLREDAI
jgi:hypothetical protein